MKNKPEIKLTYHYVEPKTEAEKESQQQDIDAAYDILFEAVLRNEQQKPETGDK